MTSSDTPWIALGNTLFAIPVRPCRLSFAIQVRRALHRLEPDERDLVAVALPASIAEATHQAIAELPRMSLVVSTVDRDEHREILPVTPADGLIEAVRSARELGVPLQFVDQEVVPGHLVDRVCLPDERWLDDDLALQYGAEKHLSLIANRLRHPPARFEPVDSWRELHMAAQLQRLVGRYRRVIFVANATHIRPVLRLVGVPAPAARPAGAPVVPRHRVLLPSLPAMLSYLGSIPRLVEMYERQRALGRAHEFDKRKAVVEALYDVGTASGDLQMSIRRFKAFAQILNRLLDDERRISPDFGTVNRACMACFPAVFHERAFQHLLGYFDLVRTQRIGRVLGTKEAVYSTAAVPSRTTRPIFVARSCSLSEQVYELVPISGAPEDGAESQTPGVPDGVIIEMDTPPGLSSGARPDFNGWNTEDWPPAEAFMRSMRQKATALARRQGEDTFKCVEYRGSTLHGFDLRRTLRSYAKQQPRLYVKQRVPSRQPPLDQYEPVMWLFEGYESVDAAGVEHEIGYDWWQPLDEQLVAGWHVRRIEDPPEIRDKFGRTIIVRVEQLAGRVTFPESRATLERLRLMDDQLSSRLPRVADIEQFAEVSARLSDDFDMEFSLSRWWEAQLAMGVTYARHGVVLVAPQRFVVPHAIGRRAAATGKIIVRIPLARFTADELRRLGTYPWIGHHYESDDHRSKSQDPRYQQRVVEHFGDVMKSRW